MSLGKKKRKKSILKLDLHGKTRDEAMVLLEDFLEENETAKQIGVIVGKGQGIIKEAVTKHLDDRNYTWTYEKVRGIENQGALIIDLS